MWLYFVSSGLQLYLAGCCSDYSNVTEHLLWVDRGLNECQTLIRHFETENVISVYTTLYDGAVDLAVQFGVVSSKTRTVGRKRNRVNPQVADTKDYKFPDHLLNKLRYRLLKNAVRFLAHVLIPITLSKLKQEDELKMYYAYYVNLQTHQEFTLEVKIWKARWEWYSTEQLKPRYLCETLELVNEEMYQHLYCVLKIYLTMPPTTGTTEISFSFFETCKEIFTRDNVTERKSDLALLHLHRDNQLQSDTDVDMFNNFKQRNWCLPCCV